MAAIVSSSKPPVTYDILYGFLGGPAHSRKLRKLLEQQGLRQVKQSEEPDILIAHSAGCWLVPEASAARLVVSIGMPLLQKKPGRTFRQANRRNVMTFIKDFRIFKGLAIGMYCVYYGVKQPDRNRSIVKQVNHGSLHIPARAEHVFIANRHDPWPQSDQLTEFIQTKDWAFIGLPGSHDDIWEHPERYAAIIRHYARLLA